MVIRCMCIQTHSDFIVSNVIPCINLLYDKTSLLARLLVKIRRIPEPRTPTHVTKSNSFSIIFAAPIFRIICSLSQLKRNENAWKFACFKLFFFCFNFTSVCKFLFLYYFFSVAIGELISFISKIERHTGDMCMCIRSASTHEFNSHTFVYILNSRGRIQCQPAICLCVHMCICRQHNIDIYKRIFTSTHI